MNDELFLQSRFWRWHDEHQPFSHDEEQALRQEALDLLVESVKAGEITSLDGVDSPLSQRIKAHHQKNDFEMNSHWVGSSQAWICPCCERSKFQISRIGTRWARRRSHKTQPVALADGTAEARAFAPRELPRNAALGRDPREHMECDTE